VLIEILLLAIVEGLTEFLPVSSTGHLAVFASIFGFNPVWREPFLVIIQFGAILAVVVDRRVALLDIFRLGWKNTFQFGMLLFLGFIPSAVLGLLFHKTISALLKAPLYISVAWIAGGIAILVIDRPKKVLPPPDTKGVLAVTPKQALLVGLAQCLSLWPGMSRSASTILGGLLFGLDRTTATLFSFYLAIPTMFAASAYEMLKFRKELEGSAPYLAVGMIGAFFVAWGTVRWLLRYVQTHTFRPFAIYRIFAGVAIFFLMPPSAE
jgi:undecaprenyl-diphosphatase